MTAMKFITAAIFAASSVACTSAHPFPCELTVDPSFSDEEIEIIRSAADEWETATGGIARVEMTIEEQRPLKHFVRNLTDEDDITRGLTKLGFANIPRDRIVLHSTAPDISIFSARVKAWIDSDWSVDGQTYAELFRGVVLHEMGHHFGLEHDRAGTLMHYAQGTYCITTIDVAQFCSIHGCEDAPKTVGSRCGTSWEDED